MVTPTPLFSIHYGRIINALNEVNVLHVQRYWVITHPCISPTEQHAQSLPEVLTTGNTITRPVIFKRPMVTLTNTHVLFGGL